MVVHVQLDTSVPFHAYFIRGRTKTEQRQHLADEAMSWLVVQKARGVKGALVFDIDDTIIDGNETVQHGFQSMRHLYQAMSLLYPIHIVTARPDDTRNETMKMLHTRGFCIPIDRLHMLPADQWGKESRYVEDFKWTCVIKISVAHRGIVARFGDKLWDVAHVEALHSYLRHVKDKDCYMCLDPAMNGALSAKLPG